MELLQHQANRWYLTLLLLDGCSLISDDAVEDILITSTDNLRGLPESAQRIAMICSLHDLGAIGGFATGFYRPLFRLWSIIKFSGNGNQRITEAFLFINHYFHSMKGHIIIFLISCAPAISAAQGLSDSLQHKVNMIYDNIANDSLQERLTLLPDTLRTFQRIDSIRNSFNQTADSIRSQYQNVISKIDAERGKINKRIDSLNHLSLSTKRYTKRLDSLNHLLQNTEEKLGAKLEALKSKTTGKIDALDLPPEFKDPIQNLTKNIEVLNLKSDIIQIPELNIPGYSVPKINDLGDLTANAGKIADISNAGKLPEIEMPAGDAGHLTQQVKGYEADIKNITQGNLEDVQALSETIEEQATHIDGIDELQKQSGIIDEHKARLDKLADPKNAKEKAMEIAKEAAVDHFAGKQEQLKAAMEKIAKYKQKYSSVSSIKDLPKRPPNPMKSKPFVERLIPGLYFQYQQKNFYLIDVNPYIGYKLTGRFTTGLGWNHRYAYDDKKHALNSKSGIFGPRAYVDFKLGKGFIAHLEGESMNTFVPSTLRGNPDTGNREWVWSFMTGLKKEYKIYKNLKGTALIQYNLFNRYYKAPYVDRLNSRIGFEYMLKKTRKEKKL